MQKVKTTGANLRITAHWFLFVEMIIIALVVIAGIVLLTCFTTNQISEFIFWHIMGGKKPDNPNLVLDIAKYFPIACVCDIALYAWLIPAILRIKKSYFDKKSHVALGVCLIIFGCGLFGMISGILMLCSGSNTSGTAKNYKV